MKIITQKRNENYDGIYLKNHYKDRDFLLAIYSNQMSEIEVKKLINDIKEKIENEGIKYFGIFEK